MYFWLKKKFWLKISASKQFPSLQFENFKFSFSVAEEPSEPTVSLATECQFDMSSYVLQFAQPTVVAAYVTLLEEYPRNSDRTNASILKMLHRLAVKLDLPALFFQLRLFRVFHRLLNEDPVGRSGRDHDPLNELRKFAIFILRRFFTLLTSNEKLAVDVLFSKSVAEARQIAACDYHKEEHKWATDDIHFW